MVGYESMFAEGGDRVLEEQALHGEHPVEGGLWAGTSLVKIGRVVGA